MSESPAKELYVIFICVSLIDYVTVDIVDDNYCLSVDRISCTSIKIISVSLCVGGGGGRGRGQHLCRFLRERLTMKTRMDTLV